MKKLSSLALAATLVGTLSISAIAPAAYAQDNTANANKGPKAEQKQNRKGKGEFRPVRGGHGFLNFVCSTQGAERLEKMLEITAIRLDVTDAQRPAFDDLKTAALTAQSDFAASCEPLKAEKAENAADRLAQRTAMMELQVAGMNTVLPAFETFYETLSDEQKAQVNKFGKKKGKKGERGKGKRGANARGAQPNAGTPAPSNG